MGHGMSGGGKTDTPAYKVKGEKLTKAIVIEEVKIIEVPKVYEVPKIEFVKQEQIKYTTKEETQVKYLTEVQNTTRYNVSEQTTVKFNIKEEATIKYVPKEVEVEKPVLTDVPYERPVITTKEYNIASIKDMDNIRALMKFIPEMSKAIDELRKKVESLVKYKLVEKVLDAPKIKWVPTTVERIIWKDVERERPK